MLSRLFPDRRRDAAFPVIGAVALFACLVAIGLVYQGFFGRAGERLVTVALIEAILVLGIQIYIGNTGVLSYGHIGFGAIAGYVFAVFAISPEQKLEQIPDAPFGLAEVDMSIWPALGIAVVVTIVVAALVGIGLARSGAESGGLSASVITLALLFVTHEVAKNWPAVTGGERAGLSFKIGGALDGRLPVYLALFGSILVARLFSQSRAGRLAIAAREDNLAARAMGVNPLVQQMTALLISVAVVSVGSGLRVYQNGSILPSNFFFNLTLVTLVMLVVGGRNSVTGALVGVVVMTGGRELTRRLGQDGFEVFGIGLDGAPLDWIFRENLQTVFLGVAMLAFMIKRPSGLLDDWEFDQWLYRRFGRGVEVKPEPLPEIEADDQTGALAVQDVDVVFGGFRALSGAGLQASPGEIVGIIGPNGAGKTTLVNVITGVVEPTTGSFSLGGVDLTDKPSYQLARSGIVRTFQNLRLFPARTVRENVEVSALIAAEHRGEQTRPDIDAIIAEAGLWEHRDRRAGELDYGNSRRLELARAAALSPSFLLLDEPTSGMSDAESLDMIEQVRHMAATVGAGVLVIDHDLGFITGISDRIYAFDQGSVIAHGTPAEIQADARVQAAYLGTAAAT